MPDKLTIEQRHYNMSRIRGKDTKPEIIVRKYLWSRGFRYRLNHPRLPGKPDVVLRKYRTCIFVNGCFWHGHKSLTLHPLLQGEGTTDAKGFETEIQSSECCKIPRTNREFWVRKIVRNMERDIEVQKRLAEMGWHSITIWECELSEKRKVKSEKSQDATTMKTQREKTLESLAFTLNHIFLQDHQVAKYELPKDDYGTMVAEDIARV